MKTCLFTKCCGTRSHIPCSPCNALDKMDSSQDFLKKKKSESECFATNSCPLRRPVQHCTNPNNLDHSSLTATADK